MAKKVITKKQKTIQTLIYSFRFINSKQIQKFLEHKDHRRINKWLKDLTEKEYVCRDFKPRFGTSTKPAIYSLAAKGRSFIRKTYSQASPKYLERISDDKQRSKAFRTHCQLVVDFFLILYPDRVKDLIESIDTMLQKGVTLKPNEFQFFTPAFFEELEFPLVFPLKSDAYFCKRNSSAVTHAFLFILDAYVPRVMLSYFLKKIFQTLDEENWEDDEIVALHFYIICPSNMVIVYLRRLLNSFLEKYYSNQELIFHFVTRNQLYKYQGAKPRGWITISSRDY